MWCFEAPVIIILFYQEIARGLPKKSPKSFDGAFHIVLDLCGFLRREQDKIVVCLLFIDTLLVIISPYIPATACIIVKRFILVMNSYFPAIAKILACV